MRCANLEGRFRIIQSIPSMRSFRFGPVEWVWRMLTYGEKLPLLCEWKCMRAGEYALGLEPTTCGVVSRAETREKGMLKTIEPGESRTFDVTIELTDDAGRIGGYIARAHRR